MFAELSNNDQDTARKGYHLKLMIKVLQNSFTAIEKCKVPVIAVVHGYCLGAGVDLLSACDMVIVTEDCQMSIREVKIGMAADLGSLSRLPLVTSNWSLLNELALTGRFFSAKEGKDLGLTHYILPSQKEALAKAHSIATEIAKNSPVAVYGTKLVLSRSKSKVAAEGLEFVREHNKSALITDDMAKAVQAIMAKEEADFPKL